MKKYFLVHLGLILQFCLGTVQACSTDDQSNIHLVKRGSEMVVRKCEANFESLLLKAQEQGRVAVIIRFNLNGVLAGRVPAEILSTPLSGLSSTQEVMLIKAISNAQDVILESLRGKGEISTVKRMKYSPSLAFTVDRKSLLALRENPNVLDIYEDKLEVLHPAEGMPSIHNNH